MMLVDSIQTFAGYSTRFDVWLGDVFVRLLNLCKHPVFLIMNMSVLHDWRMRT